MMTTFGTLAFLCVLAAGTLWVSQQERYMTPTHPRPNTALISDVLVRRRQRVYRLMIAMTKEANAPKIAQAKYLLRMIDNRLAQLSVQNIFMYN